MDLAKMLAVLELISPHHPPGTEGAHFRIWKQTRIGLLSHPLDPDAARGHLAASTYLQMALKPHIYHIVGHTEAHHAATAEDIIEASKIVRRAITNALGAPDMTKAPEVQERKEILIAEAKRAAGAYPHDCPARRGRSLGRPGHPGEVSHDGVDGCASIAQQQVWAWIGSHPHHQRRQCRSG